MVRLILLILLVTGLVVFASAWYFNANYRVLTTETKVLDAYVQRADWGRPDVSHLLEIRTPDQQDIVIIDIEQHPKRLVSIDLGLPLSLLQPYNPFTIAAKSEEIFSAGGAGGDGRLTIAYLEFKGFESAAPVFLVGSVYGSTLLWIASNLLPLLIAVGFLFTLVPGYFLLLRRKSYG